MPVTQQVEKEFDSVRELAQRIGRDNRTIYRAIKAGKIRSVRFGGSVLIPRREVNRVLTKGF